MDVIGFVSEHSPAVDARARFQAIVERTEPSLRRALVSAYGLEAGRDATAEALAWAWEHLDRLDGIENPGGYLWRVGQTAARRGRRWSARLVDVRLPDVGTPPGGQQYEPGLRAALARLSARQRAAVLLVDGWGYTLEATAETLGCSVSAVRNHRDRAQAKLRAALGVKHD